MGLVKIYVEGVTDVNFIRKYLKYLRDLDFGKNDIIDVKGKDALVYKVEDLNQNSDQLGGINLVIFDADDDFDLRKKQWDDFKRKHSVKFDLFLFPDNSSNGELEDLLCKLMIAKHSVPIFSCFDNFNECLMSNSYEPSNIKGRVYAYVDALTKDENITPYDFLNSEIWDLDNVALNPLKEFLRKYLP